LVGPHFDFFANSSGHTLDDCMYIGTYTACE
jgi:hypothetical protein